jgi:phosphoenolpyruvate synthase/pyruvate phosphate dikinase
MDRWSKWTARAGWSVWCRGRQVAEVRSFAELTAEQVALAGGKGGTPARLYRAGYPVPDGFVIPPVAFAGSAGRVEGFVRRLHSAEDGDRLQPGEIHIAVATNVGWTPLFPRAAAVVTDVGAPLSHAAIVARELGVPAVVGCGNATMRLKTGDRVRVDGGRGIVEILEQA